VSLDRPAERGHLLSSCPLHRDAPTRSTTTHTSVTEPDNPTSGAFSRRYTSREPNTRADIRSTIRPASGPAVRRAGARTTSRNLAYLTTCPSSPPLVPAPFSCPSRGPPPAVPAARVRRALGGWSGGLPALGGSPGREQHLGTWHTSRPVPAHHPLSQPPALGRAGAAASRLPPPPGLGRGALPALSGWPGAPPALGRWSGGLPGFGGRAARAAQARRVVGRVAQGSADGRARRPRSAGGRADCPGSAGRREREQHLGTWHTSRPVPAHHALSQPPALGRAGAAASRLPPPPGLGRGALPALSRGALPGLGRWSGGLRGLGGGRGTGGVGG
jgi:hypothetical protein